MGSCGDPLEACCAARPHGCDGPRADGSSSAARSNEVASKSTSLTTTLSQSRAAAPGATGRPAGRDAGIGAPDHRAYERPRPSELGRQDGVAAEAIREVQHGHVEIVLGLVAQLDEHRAAAATTPSAPRWYASW